MAGVPDRRRRVGSAHSCGKRTGDEPGRRTLLVHIGLPKTGSTSIQRMLRVLARPLRRRGIHVPGAGRNADGAHWNLVHEYMGNRKYEARRGGWAELSRELRESRSARRFVISAEAFSMRRAEDAAIPRIASLAGAADLDVEIVAYVRPQHRFIESDYSDSCKGFEMRPFEAFLEARLDHSRYDYNECFRPWRKAFGNRLGVYPLEAAHMPAGLLPHFLAVLGVPELSSRVALPRLNRRLGARQLEVARLVSVALHDEMLDRETASRLLGNVLRGVARRLTHDAPFVGLDPEQRRAVAERFAESNARFARDYGIDGDGVLFRSPAVVEGERGNRARWEDFTDQERRTVTRIVRDLAGVDLPRATRRRVPNGATNRPGKPSWWGVHYRGAAGTSSGAWARREHGPRGGVRLVGEWRGRWWMLRQALRRRASSRVVRIVRDVRAACWIRYWRARATRRRCDAARSGTVVRSREARGSEARCAGRGARRLPAAPERRPCRGGVAAESTGPGRCNACRTSRSSKRCGSRVGAWLPRPPWSAGLSRPSSPPLSMPEIVPPP